MALMAMVGMLLAPSLELSLSAIVLDGVFNFYIFFYEQILTHTDFPGVEFNTATSYTI